MDTGVWGRSIWFSSWGYRSAKNSHTRLVPDGRDQVAFGNQVAAQAVEVSLSARGMDAKKSHGLQYPYDCVRAGTITEWSFQSGAGLLFSSSHPESRLLLEQRSVLVEYS